MQHFQMFAGSSLLNVKIFSFSLVYMIVNDILLGLGPLVGQNEQFKNVTLGSGKLLWAYVTIF